MNQATYYPVAATALATTLRARALDGRRGTNRCRTRANQLGVDDDVRAIAAWIADRAASPATARDFWSQARRLLWWAVERCPNPQAPAGVGKALADLTRADLQCYREWLRRPDRGAIGPKRPFLRNGRINPQWRPVEGPLTAAHIEHVFLVLGNLFRYLADMGYLDGNPLAGMRACEKGSMGDHSRRRRRVERSLDAEQWLAVLEAIEELPRQTRREQQHYERARFLMQLFFHLGARIGEVATHRMRHFRRTRQGHWQWSVMGKGGKEAEVPVNAALLAALARYRVFCGLPPLPQPDEDTPLVADLRTGRPLGQRQITRVVKEIFARAADRLQASKPAKAARLRHASPHWIRHAMASFAAERARDLQDLRALQQLMRHGRLETTLGYTHVADEAQRMIADWLSEASTGDGDISITTLPSRL